MCDHNMLTWPINGACKTKDNIEITRLNSGKLNDNVAQKQLNLGLYNHAQNLSNDCHKLTHGTNHKLTTNDEIKLY